MTSDSIQAGDIQGAGIAIGTRTRHHLITPSNVAGILLLFLPTQVYQLTQVYPSS